MGVLVDPKRPQKVSFRNHHLMAMRTWINEIAAHSKFCYDRGRLQFQNWPKLKNHSTSSLSKSSPFKFNFKSKDQPRPFSKSLLIACSNNSVDPVERFLLCFHNKFSGCYKQPSRSRLEPWSMWWAISVYSRTYFLNSFLMLKLV